MFIEAVTSLILLKVFLIVFLYALNKREEFETSKEKIN